MLPKLGFTTHFSSRFSTVVELEALKHITMDADKENFSLLLPWAGSPVSPPGPTVCSEVLFTMF